MQDDIIRMVFDLVGTLYRSSTPSDGERMAVVGAARATVAALGGGLERTLTALEPYLMQIRLERRADDA